MEGCMQILAHLCPDLEYTMTRISNADDSDATYDNHLLSFLKKQSRHMISS